ncbi:MAG: hypothetical protein ABSA54_07040 [Terriglobales bacterium]|jgi:hypothetical protein
MNSQNRYSSMSIAGVVFACAALLSGQPSQAQQIGFPEDWSHRHVVFSNPGTYREAIENGSSEKWVRINNDPRFIMQRMKRNAEASASRSQEITAAPVSELRASLRTRKEIQLAPLSRDWSVSLGAGGVAAGQYPAKFTFAPIGTPSCTADFATYGVNAAGASGTPGQANIVGFNQLYVNSTGTGICAGTAPTVYFSYFVGTGQVQTSPSISFDGTKIAYIESVAGASKLHVTTIGTTGSNGTSATSPVAPGTGNNAADTAVTLNGAVNVSVSSPFVDYTNDIAYVGDDNGILHKFTHVFGGTPTEVIGGGTGWPVTVNAGKILTGPVWDSVTSRVYVGDSAGILHSVSTTGTVTSSGIVAAGGGIVDAPLLDSGAERVYVFVGDNAAGTASAVVQFNISSGNIISAGKGTAKTLGLSNATTPLYIGMFDNTYFSTGSVPGPTGNLYTCGKTGGLPTLYHIPINGNVIGAPVAGPVLANAVGAGCSPVSENYNSPDDWIFVSVPSNSCGATGGTTAGGCLMSFNVASAAPTIGPWLPSTVYKVGNEVVDTNGNIQEVIGVVGAKTSGTSAPAWTTTFTPDADVDWEYQSASNGQTTAAQPTGTSGIAVDNATASPLTSNIYFGTLSGTGTTNSAVKMTQAGLQ